MKQHLQSHRFPSLRRQRGVNLIEIMVAMAIGLFLVLGATTLYVSTKKTSDVDDSIARLQETARYALSVIETDVRMANYWGMKKDGADFENKATNTNVTNTVGTLTVSTGAVSCGTTYATDTENYIAASNNDYASGIGCTANGSASASADTLTIRRVATTTTPATDTRLQVCSTRKTATMTRDNAATCPNGEFHNLVVNGYYIDNQSDQSSTLPSLRRKTLGTNNAGTSPAFNDVEIIPGVEDMQIELGWDNSSTDAAGAVRYGQPGTLPAGGRIIAVRVWLLVRAEQRDTTFTDARTYSYADRTGTATATLTDGAAYAPADNFRRLLVSRTFFVRNVTGT